MSSVDSVAVGTADLRLVRVTRGEEVDSFVLAVIADNEPAIRAYEKAGFGIHRRFHCYKLEQRQDLDVSIRGRPNPS